MQNSFLKGKNALITGSTSGIGLGIAQALAAQGINILFNGFGEAAAVANIQKNTAQTYQVTTDYFDADLSKPDEISAMMAYASEKLGDIDILVNNAGIQYVANIEEFPEERWNMVIAINLSAAFHTIRLCMPGMRQKNWGRIINIASAHGLVASAQKSAYVAAKHGLVGLTKVVALETAQSGITCNAICPGWVLTALIQKQIEVRAARGNYSIEEAKKRLLEEKQPSQEFVTTEQIGALAAFLCSEAAEQVRGAAWSIDGGWLAQ